MDNFYFRDHSIFKNDKLIKSFSHPIDEILEYRNFVVLLFNSDYYKKDNENVICIDDKGNQKWKVPKYEYMYDRSPFVGMDIEENNVGDVKLTNWDSSYVIIEIETGKVKVDAFSSRKGRRPW